MADFSALKQSIQNYIKQNGNKEITGSILQNILLSMVTTMGDGAINDNASDISDIQNEIQNIITSRLNAGALYAGYATPSTTPATLTNQEVFYLATQAGTYTNFHFNGGDDPIVLTKDGIYFIVSGNDDDDWNAEPMLQLDDVPTASSNNAVKSGGVANALGDFGYSKVYPFTKVKTSVVSLDVMNSIIKEIYISDENTSIQQIQVSNGIVRINGNGFSLVTTKTSGYEVVYNINKGVYVTVDCDAIGDNSFNASSIAYWNGYDFNSLIRERGKHNLIMQYMLADKDVYSAINQVASKLQSGYLYVGVATPSSTPVATLGQKLFYIAMQAGTYTNFLNNGDTPITITKDGIYIFSGGVEADDWLLETVQEIDDAPTAGSDNSVKSGGVAKALNTISEVSKEFISENKKEIKVLDDNNNSLLSINSNGVDGKNLKSNGNSVLIGSDLDELNEKTKFIDTLPNEQSGEEISLCDEKGEYTKITFGMSSEDEKVAFINSNEQKVVEIGENGIYAKNLYELNGNLIFTSDKEFSVSMRNTNTFVGSMNTAIDAILAAKQKTLFCFISMFTDDLNWMNGSDIVKIQRALAEYWCAPFIDIHNDFGLVKRNGQNTLEYWIKDGTHPANYPDWDVVDNVPQYTMVKRIANAIAPKMKFIFDDWSDKNILWIGTSIPAGNPHEGVHNAMYPALVADILGCTCNNKSVSSSCVRLSKVDGTLIGSQYNPLLDPNSLTSLNWIVNNINDYDLVVVDHGRNDFVQDQTDFNILLYNV